MRPGIYRLSFRGLTVREAWRFGGDPLRFAIALVLKVVAFKGPLGRLPTYRVELECEESSIPVLEHEQFFQHVAEARGLGYQDGRFYRATEILDPEVIDGFSYLALHADRIRWLFIGAVRRSALANRCTVTSTGGLRTATSDEVEFVAHRFYFDAPPPSMKVAVAGKGVGPVHARMGEYLRQHPGLPFVDFAALKRHGEFLSDRAFDARIARGLFVFERD